jgi:glycosyltransferase involved in cell wall biosynthesis
LDLGFSLLYLTLDDLSRPGAWRSHVLGVTGALARQGWRVKILSPGEGMADLPPGVEGRWIPRARRRAARLALAALRDPRLLADELSSFRPDAIYMRGVNILPGWGPALSHPVPRVVEINGYAEDEAAPLLRPRVRAAHRRAFCAAAAVTVVSGKLRADMVRQYALPPDRVFVVANGADPGRFGIRGRDECRRRLGWPPDAPHVVFVGSFYPHHGLDLAVDAAAIVSATRADVRFVLAGDGADHARIGDLVKSRGLNRSVSLPGAIDPPSVPDLLGAADICLLTLRSVRTPQRGCSPIKLYEYMAAGRPVAARVDTPEVAEEIRTAGAGLAGLLTGQAVDDARALAEDLLKLLADPALSTSLGAAGRRAVESMYNWDRAGRRTAAILEAALGRAPWPDPREAS